MLTATLKIKTVGSLGMKLYNSERCTRARAEVIRVKGPFMAWGKGCLGSSLQKSILPLTLKCYRLERIN